MNSVISFENAFMHVSILQDFLVQKVECSTIQSDNDAEVDTISKSIDKVQKLLSKINKQDLREEEALYRTKI